MNTKFVGAALVLLVLGLLSGCSAMRARTVEIEHPPQSKALLTSGTWTLAELNGVEVAPTGGGVAPSIHFDRETMRASGHAAVNRFSGNYSVQNESMTFGPLAATKMAGPEEMNQLEARFLKALGETDRWRIAEEKLELLAGESVLARFVKVPAEAAGGKR